MLVYHMNRISRLSAQNSMDAKNLAIVFAPNLFRPEEESPEVILADAPFATELMMDLINRSDLYFREQQAAAPQQTAAVYDEYDEMARLLDPFALANYIQHFISQGAHTLNLNSVPTLP